MILIDNEDGDDEDDTLFYNTGIGANVLSNLI